MNTGYSVYINGFDIISLGGAYLICTIALVLFLYAYIIHLYKSQKKGKIDYEKYGLLAVNDSLEDKPIESATKKGDK